MLARLAVHYPSSKNEAAQLVILAEDWFDEFRSLSSEQFHAAVKHTMSRCKWFPTMADVNESITELTEQCNSRRLAQREAAETKLIMDRPSYKSDEDIKSSKEKLAVLQKLVSKQITQAEADEQMAELCGLK